VRNARQARGGRDLLSGKSAASSASQERDRFRPLLLVGLGLLVVAQVPPTSRLAPAAALAAQREELVRRSVATSDNERRRIAAEVHDGPFRTSSALPWVCPQQPK
jgi:signal transduction histidine kinase